MKIVLKIADIEVSLDGGDEKNRKKLIKDGLRCVAVLIAERIDANYVMKVQAEQAEDQPSSLTVVPLIQTKPDITMQHIYA